jgi:hypothetical protein
MHENMKIIVVSMLARLFFELHKLGTCSLAILLLLKNPIAPFKVEYEFPRNIFKLKKCN